MKGVLIVSIGFSPNVGGIETHFDDLTKILDSCGWRTWVLTYKPITTKVPAKIFEKRGKNVSIYRIPWIGGIFYRLVDKPFVEFFYLLPGLFLFLPIFLLIGGRSINVIHSHGLIAGAVSVFWGKIFGKRVITTTHSIYSFPKKGFYRIFSRWIFNGSDAVLTLSKQSKKEITNLGIDEKKIKVFTYWVNQEIFKPVANAKKILGWENKFVVFSAGRLVPEKGINELIEAFNKWDKNITLVIAGVGTLEEKVKKIKKDNFVYLGRVDNDKLPVYYSAADLFIVPSVSEEGFGRNILESLSCGTPVIGANRGAIPEAMDNSVGKLIEISLKSIKNTVEYFYKNPDKIQMLSKKAVTFAKERYSKKNVKTIIESYAEND